MLDPFTLACILAVVAGVIAIIFYLFSGTDDERDFEKAFGENARKLLNQEREKHKTKVKIPKKKEGREKRAEVRQEADADVDLAVAGGDSVTEPVENVPVSTSVSTNGSPPEPKMKKHSKKEKNAVVASEIEKLNAEPAANTMEEIIAPNEPASEENKENRQEQTSISEGKKKKKTKAKKEEDASLSQQFVSELAHEESTGEPHSSTNSKSEKERKPKKKIAIVNINDLDSNKVLTRIASLEEIEPEYISYLASYFHDTNAKINGLENAIVEFERKDLEHKKKIDQYQQSRLISDRQIADHVRVISELTSKLQALSVSEAAAKRQIMQLNNVCVENDTLKSALSKSAADAAAASKAISNLEAMKVNNAELTDRLAKMNKSLNETVEQNAALKREIAEFAKQAAALDHLKQEFATLDTAARQLKAELEEKTRVIEETKLMASNADSVKRAESERDEIAHQFAQARSEWEQKEAALMNEYTSLKNLVDELNKEVAKFEQFKKEQDELEQKLLAKEAELAEKSARLAAAETEKQVLVVQGNGRSAELEVENAELRKKLIELEKKLSEAMKAQSEALAELASARAQANEEIVVLKKSQPVDASNVKNADASDGVSNLRLENERLQQKNEELRERNFKILDHVASLEKQLREKISSESAVQSSPAKAHEESCHNQLLEERKLVASTIGSIVNSPLNDSSYDDYVKRLAKSLRTALNKERKSHEVDGANNTNEELREELENYRSSFQTLSLLLSQIEMGVNERESFYKDKVAHLESELDKANGVIASANRLRKELKECEFLKKQIQALRKCLGQPEEGKEIASSRGGTMKSDESDWEVVSR
ncbi:hypothetical protein V3C99_015289 [Haemonchus contortus]|uniref:TMF_TATA_bd domain-containing protein n=2 Tax=Haemonchus contortus TaxID=6289 RepID=A0A7I4YTY2_HAECO